VGQELLGRVIDFMGNPLDNLGTVQFSRRRPVERRLPPHASRSRDRSPADRPQGSGRPCSNRLGQRELIIGDRQSGKTSVILDTIINQKGRDVICVYCAIGQQGSSVAKLVADLQS
jgi:F-type H+-transporting ATPase subunit alpha